MEKLGLITVLEEDLSRVKLAAGLLMQAHESEAPREAFIEAQASLAAVLSTLGSHALGFCFIDLSEERMNAFVSTILPGMVADWRAHVRKEVDTRQAAEQMGEAQGGVQ